MRGTGCSGGAFDFFEPLQSLDGYDVVGDGRPPALGLSRQGRHAGHLLRRPSASSSPRKTQPPDLAAITPLSVIDQTQTTPLSRRHPQHRLRPQLGQGSHQRGQARRPGPGPALGVSEDPGGRCDLRGQPGAAPRGPSDLLAKVRANDHYIPEVADPVSPIHVRPQDQRPGLHGLPVHRRAGPAGTARPWRST